MSTNPSSLVEKSQPGERAPAWLSGFLLLGTLLGLLGSLLVAWEYHIDVEPRVIGFHFLALSGGYVAAAAIAQKYVQRVPVRWIAVISCAAAFASLVALALLAPPAAAGWRIAGLAALGMSAGGLTAALLYAMEPAFSAAPAATANVAALLFGCGCLCATLVTGIAYAAGSMRWGTASLAGLPLLYLFIYLRSSHPPARNRVSPRKEDVLRETLKDLRSIATILFTLLVFFQFGNEWALAGWLPLFLIHRLGISPLLALGGLALYFLSLMIGRTIAQSLLAAVNHRRMLLGSVFLAMTGYLWLSFAGSLAAATAATTIIGVAFGPIFPLIAEQLDDRFSYHPGFYNGTISIAVSGAMSAPWLLGYVDAYLGMQYVMLIPALGSVAVLILTFLLMLEARLMGGKRTQPSETLIAGD
ncbi:MAG TPA: MFS transporter [Bryobacteraceae bacterium]|nr:MFS transporter [Bryobacteraceae bacterium]